MRSFLGLAGVHYSACPVCIIIHCHVIGVTVPFQNNQDFEALIKTCIAKKSIAGQVQSPVTVSISISMSSERPGRSGGDSLQKEKHTASSVRHNSERHNIRY